jgi:hypothetical protein
MITASQRKGRRFVTMALCFALVAMTGAVAPVQGAPAAELWLRPEIDQARSGDTRTLILGVKVENLDRAELHLAYHSSELEVQDADPGRTGVQVAPGPIFDETCVQWNEAEGGKIHFVATRSPDREPFSGSGTAASITLLVKTTGPGIYTVSFDQAETALFDRQGHSIPIDRFTDAVIIVPPLTVTGRVTREGWHSHERSGVNLMLYPATPPYKPSLGAHRCTDAAGHFTSEAWSGQQPPLDDVPPTLPPCTYRRVFVRLDFPNYLSECYWKCADDDVLDIGWHDLEGGDVNEDGCINILDIVPIIEAFGDMVEPGCCVHFTQCPDCASPGGHAAPPCDINGDCRVDILDLAQSAGNFGLCTNCP